MEPSLRFSRTFKICRLTKETFWMEKALILTDSFLRVQKRWIEKTNSSRDSKTLKVDQFSNWILTRRMMTFKNCKGIFRQSICKRHKVLESSLPIKKHNKLRVHQSSVEVLAIIRAPLIVKWKPQILQFKASVTTSYMRKSVSRVCATSRQRLTDTRTIGQFLQEMSFIVIDRKEIPNTGLCIP